MSDRRSASRDRGREEPGSRSHARSSRRSPSRERGRDEPGRSHCYPRRRSVSREGRDEASGRNRTRSRRSLSRDRGRGRGHDESGTSYARQEESSDPKYLDRTLRRSSRERERSYDRRRERSSRRTYGPSPSPPARRRAHSSSSSSSSVVSDHPHRSGEHHHAATAKSKSRRDYSSSSGDDSYQERKHSSKSKGKRSHKSTHRSHTPDSSDDYHRKKKSRAEKKERKRKKKEKEEKKKSKKDQHSKHKSAISEYGKYGIITEADMFTKDQEFRAWMVEEKMLNPETVPQMKMKELFKVYMEDYNTATLPHEKYYALEKYEARMDAIRSGNVVAQSDTYDPRADEAALAAQHKRVAKNDGNVYIGRAQLEQLRRIERERVEASRMKRMGMEVKESMGVRYEAD